MDIIIKMDDVHIKKVNRGYIMTIGCNTFVFEDEEIMLKIIKEYHASPEVTIKNITTEHSKIQGHWHNVTDTTVGTPRTGACKNGY